MSLVGVVDKAPRYPFISIAWALATSVFVDSVVVEAAVFDDLQTFAR